MAQGKPMPRKTFTAFEPLTFPMELSAYLSCSAATFEANVSENENGNFFFIRISSRIYRARMFLMQQKQWQSLYQLNQRYNQTGNQRDSRIAELIHRFRTCVAKSPMSAVSIPMIEIDTQKHTQPPPMPNRMKKKNLRHTIARILLFTRRWYKCE